MIARINIVEAASKIASDRVARKYDQLDRVAYAKGKELFMTTTYTEEAQEDFNQFYDEAWDILDKAIVKDEF